MNAETEFIRIVIPLICLGAASLWDIRSRTIPLPIILLMTGSGLFLRIVEGSFLSGELLLSLLPGLACLLFSIRSRQVLGIGDALLLFGMGSWLSPEKVIGAGLAAFTAAGLVGLFLLVCRGKSRDYALPFAPFLMSGTFFLLLGGGR